MKPMNMKLIALAVSGIAASGALAQSNVELYGAVDLSVVSMTGSYSGQVGGTVGTAAGTTNGVYNGVGKSSHSANGLVVGGTTPITEYGSRAELASGNRTASMIGFRGTENLGGGLKAAFLIESSIAADGGTANGANAAPAANIIGDREATIALSSSLGQVKAGRMQHAIIDQIDDIDVFQGNGPGTIENLIISPLSSTRSNNTLRFDTEQFGVKWTYQYAMSENSDRLNNTSGPGSITNFAAVYAHGPLMVAAGHMIARDFGNGLTPTTTGLAGESARVVGLEYRSRSLAMNQLGGTYDFGPVKLHAQYLTTVSTKTASDTSNAANTTATAAATTLGLLSWVGREQPLINSSTYMLGLSAPIGKHKLLGSFVSTNDKRDFNQDARSLALGYEYALSKRTTLYARGAKVYNTNGAVFGVTGGAMAVALAQAGDANNRTNAYLAGVSHTF